jgi:hypothetical protein
MEKTLLRMQPTIHTGRLELTYVKLSGDQEVEIASSAYLSAMNRLKDVLGDLAAEPISLSW